MSDLLWKILRIDGAVQMSFFRIKLQNSNVKLLRMHTKYIIVPIRYFDICML